jgi:hypothetical protein
MNMLTQARILEIKEAMDRLPLFEAIDFLMSAAYERGVEHGEGGPGEDIELSHEDIRSGGYPDMPEPENYEDTSYFHNLMSKDD